MVGRPRKSMSLRHKGGKIIQPTHEQGDDLRLADNGTPERYRRRLAVWGSDAEIASKHTREIDCPVDLLHGFDKLDDEQHSAARKAISTYNRFAASKHSPRVVSGNLGDYIQGSRGEPMSTDDAEDAAKAFDKMRRAIMREVRHKFTYPDQNGKKGPLGTAWANAQARKAWRCVHNVMQRRSPESIDALKWGLDAIVDFYDLKPKSKIGVYRKPAEPELEAA